MLVSDTAYNRSILVFKTFKMRYNDKEILKLTENKVDLEGVLQHMKPQGSNWSDWYQQPSFKERYFKLVSNLLFYYRINDPEPLGILVLENAHVSYERPHRGIPFAFSITFKVNDKFRDNESKHVFSCKCDTDVSKWVAALKMASYEYWRSQYIILRTKISMKTGQDPVLAYMRNKTTTEPENTFNSCETRKPKIKQKAATFYSHIQSTEFYSEMENTYSTSSSQLSNNSTAVENLIDL